MKKLLLTTTMVLLMAVLLPGHILAQFPFGEWGDAPEGALAYPPLPGVTGSFPTCMNVPIAGFIYHNNFGAFFGPTFDFEPEGNAGLCPIFGPYDADECWQDGDAGLLIPPAYTIDQTPAVVPCIPGAQGPLGQTCQTAVWGVNIDIDVSNFMPSLTLGYVNVIIDWNQDGFWGGSSPCPPTGTPAPEHVLQNFFPVPNPFTGPLSVLGPPPFLIGPNPGYVWARFTISELPVAIPWDGSGFFEDGESEDYLLLIDPIDDPTVFPVIPTECPIVETECPAVFTRCPVVPTECPVIETECPVDPTICEVTECPVIITECPTLATECPTIETLCPDIPTWCPDEPTLCPKDPPFCPPEEFTIWPEILTECPIFFTECPQGPTLCPDPPTFCQAADTWCPEIPTQCPVQPAFTFCPVNETQCPDDPTNCPLDWTFCPDIPTVCPDIQTVCPEIVTVCPQEPTQCFPDPTICEITVCPQDPTICEVTECPVIPTSCPATVTLCATVDTDGDGVDDCNDNCIDYPNGPSQGTCTVFNAVTGNWNVSTGQFCTVDGDCDPGEFCEKIQADNYPPGGGNGIGDACDCEADFNCDQNVDGGDVGNFLANFGRSIFFNPCTNAVPCDGDFLCDGDVDGGDVEKFLEDFARSIFFNSCPLCITGPWCSYP